MDADKNSIPVYEEAELYNDIPAHTRRALEKANTTAKFLYAVLMPPAPIIGKPGSFMDETAWLFFEISFPKKETVTP